MPVFVSADSLAVRGGLPPSSTHNPSTPPPAAALCDPPPSLQDAEALQAQQRQLQDALAAAQGEAAALASQLDAARALAPQVRPSGPDYQIESFGGASAHAGLGPYRHYLRPQLQTVVCIVHDARLPSCPTPPACILCSVARSRHSAHLSHQPHPTRLCPQLEAAQREADAARSALEVAQSRTAALERSYSAAVEVRAVRECLLPALFATSTPARVGKLAGWNSWLACRSAIANGQGLLHVCTGQPEQARALSKPARCVAVHRNARTSQQPRLNTLALSPNHMPTGGQVPASQAAAAGG